MGRLSIKTRQQVVLLRSLGYTVKKIWERLLEEGIAVSKFALYKLLKKHQSAGTVADLPRRSITPKIKQEHLAFIDKCMVENDELTAWKLRDKLLEDWPELAVSIRTVRRARWMLGWRATRPKYCQLVREANKKKRLDWCKQRLEENDQFGDVIFTDECSVQLDSHGRLCFRKKDQPQKMKPKPKHPIKVHIWVELQNEEQRH